MKVLVLGSGGREHAIRRALMTSDPKPDLFIAPGNPGTAECGTNVSIKVDDLEAIVEFGKEENIDAGNPGPRITTGPWYR